jgi:hypothetical protein
MFLRNVGGVAFYAVPHAGSNIAEYVNKLLRCNIRRSRHHRRLMDNVQPWKRDMEELSTDFEDIANGKKINIYAFCEGRPMKEVVRIWWIKWIFCNQPQLKNWYCLVLTRAFCRLWLSRGFWWKLAQHND